ncbi:MAG: hypothetical protein LC104_09605 [Bacteroidales bacterium]|nr:hypothetical protein [Bacteroidales bacterium]
MNPIEEPLTVSGTVNWGRRQRPAPAPAIVGRIPRVSRLMALAIHDEARLRAGTVTHADLARAGLVTRARVTQVLNLVHLAPDIQEAILFLPRVQRGRAAIILRDLQPITAIPDWREQRKLWHELRKRRGMDSESGKI